MSLDTYFFLCLFCSIFIHYFYDEFNCTHSTNASSSSGWPTFSSKKIIFFLNTFFSKKLGDKYLHSPKSHKPFYDLFLFFFFFLSLT